MKRICEVCGVVSAVSASFSHSDNGVVYDLYGCNECKAQFFSPLKNPGAHWYESDSRYASRNQDPILAANRNHEGVLRRFRKPGRVLDVGCGVGNFLAYAEANGWEGWGLDFDADSIQAAKDTFKLSRVTVDDLSGFASKHPNDTFDLVTFFDVFEHIDNHAEFLELVRRLLVPGGSLAMSSPYRHGWRWLMPHDLPPRHLTRWDEDSISIILKRYGFELRTFVRAPASLYFIIMKLRYRYGGWTSIGLVARTQTPKTAVGSRGPTALKQKGIHFLARSKDYILFGVPALIVWSVLLFTRRRYTDFYAIATRTD